MSATTRTVSRRGAILAREALDADVLAVVRSTVQPAHATLWIRR